MLLTERSDCQLNYLYGFIRIGHVPLCSRRVYFKYTIISSQRSKSLQDKNVEVQNEKWCLLEYAQAQENQEQSCRMTDWAANWSIFKNCKDLISRGTVNQSAPNLSSKLFQHLLQRNLILSTSMISILYGHSTIMERNCPIHPLIIPPLTLNVSFQSAAQLRSTTLQSPPSCYPYSGDE